MSASVSRERSIRTLKRLRDEVYSGYAASPNSLLQHAMMLVEGESFSETESQSSWTDYGVADRGMTIYPIKGLMGRGRYQCYFGHADTALIARFGNQAKGLFVAALEVLGSEGREYERPPFCVDGWVYLCYCLAWDFRERVDYEVRNESEFSRACFGTKGPFVDRGTFTSWSKRGEEYAEGVFFGNLSADVRACSVSAVDAILSLAPEPAAAEKPRRRSDQAMDARNKWIYEQAQDGIPHKNILADLQRKRQFITIQRVGQIVKEYARRNGLPLEHAPRGRLPVQEPGWPEKG
jgi:hypothetical protein